jgi:hypothetical protein
MLLASFESGFESAPPSRPGEHYRLIAAATWQKVLQNPDVRRVLLAIGDLVLKPDHYQEPDPPAAWRDYQILSVARSRLQKGLGPPRQYTQKADEGR